MAHELNSPGISVQVIDQTSFTAVSQGLLFATVGFAERGPLDEPTLTFRDTYKTTFGDVVADNPYMGMFANKILDYTNGYFTRIAKAREYEYVEGSVAASLDMSSYTTPVFWVLLEDFPEPNNGMYRVTITNSTYADLDALISAINTAMASVTLADGSTALSSYITADEDTGGTKLQFKSDSYANVRITLRADEGADNIVKTTGTGYLGFADEASSTDTGSLAYAFITVPVNETLATNASITASAAMTQDDLDQLDAFSKVDIAVDGDDTNPFREYADVNIKPTGTAGTFPAMTAATDISGSFPGLTLTGGDYDITLAGFYHFIPNDTTGEVNTTHSLTVAVGPHANLPALILALNAALDAEGPFTGGGFLGDYVQFADNGSGYLTTVKGTTGTLNNYGAAVSVTIADGGTALISELGYTTTTNDSGTGVASTYTASGVAAKISGAVTEATASSSTDIISIQSNRTGTTSFIRINDATAGADENAIALIHFTDDDKATGTNSSNDGNVHFVCLEAGTWGDSLKVRTYTSINALTGATEYNIDVLEDENIVEIHKNIVWTDTADANFVKTRLADSAYITVEFGDSIEYPSTDTTTTALTADPPVNGTPEPDYWQLDGGNNGIPSDSTELDGLAVTALDEYANREQYEIDMLAAPGFVGNAVTSKLQSVAEARQDILALVDPPFGLEWDEAIDWHNGSYGGGSTSLTSSFVVATWGWQRDFDPDNEEYIDLPPSIYEGVAIISTAKNYNRWEAPAGPLRGVVNSVSSYTKPTAAEREFLNNDVDPACINPIVQFPTEGTMIYGQKTCLKVAKATNRINVRLTVNWVYREVERIGRNYIFALNNPTTWASLKRDLDAFLANVATNGGLTGYETIVDATTNTPDRIDAGIIYAKIFIEPARVGERVFIDLTLNSTSGTVTATAG